MTEHLQDRVVVVTGAGSGFGRLISKKAAALGAKVVCCDINEDTVSAVAEEIKADGGEVIGCGADVSSLDSVKAVVNAAVDKYGRIDVMINNAGIMPLAFFSDHENAIGQWTRCIDINIKGVLHGIVAVYDQMIRQGRGHVVNVSSIYSNFPVAGSGVYQATKVAVNYLSESLRAETQGKIKVTVVKPTGVPATNLKDGVLNPMATVGINGQNMELAIAKRQAMMAGQQPEGETDPGDIAYLNLDPDSLTDSVIYAINQPWGVSIADITVRSSGETYVL